MIPAPNFTLDQLISNFQAQELDIVDLVTLSVSHTTGRSRCTSFKQRLYTPQIYLELDYHHRYSVFSSALRSMCPASGRDNALVPLDLKTSRRFDNLYFFNLLRGNGLLQSDNVQVSEDPDGEVLSLVWAYASNQELSFKHFAKSMIKMGNINVLTGDEGEIRHNCRYVNKYYH